MLNNCSNANKMILGAVLGSVIAGVSTILLNTEKGKALKDDSLEKMYDIKEKIECFLKSMGDKTYALTNQMGHKSDTYAAKLHEFTEDVTDHIKALGTNENTAKFATFLIGGLVGGIVGAKIACFATCQKDTKNTLFKNVGCAATSFKETISEMLNRLNDNSNSYRLKASCDSNDTSRSCSSVEDVLNFVTTGAKIWQRMQNNKH